MNVKTQALFDTDGWYVEVEGIKYLVADQDEFGGHAHLRYKEDVGRSITVELSKKEGVAPSLLPAKFLYGGLAKFIYFSPIYEHGFPNCEFWGTWYGYDVWYYTGEDSYLGGSIIARHGNDPGDYASSPISLLLSQLSDPRHCIKDMTVNPPICKPYRDWIWENSKPRDYHRAWFMALATQFVKLKCQTCEGD